MSGGSGPGHLHLLSLPIGNRGDVTLRVLEALRELDVVAAEDTRTTGALLARYGIERRLVSYHDHNERARSRELLRVLESGRSVGLVSDAGTPLVSDPGHRLVVAAVERGIPVHALPGPSAPIAALAVSGLPVDDVRLLGFAPRKAGERRTRLRELATCPSTLVLFESPARLLTCLADARDALGDRRVCVANDLTKTSERILYGTLSEVLDALRAEPRLHGEFTLVVEPPPEKQTGADWARARSLDAELAGLGVSTRDRARVIAAVFELPRREVYAELLAGEKRR